MFTATIATIAVVTAYTFITGLIATVLRCWRDAKPVTQAVEVEESKAALPLPEATETVETDDPWNDETVTPVSNDTVTITETIEYRVLILPPATKKRLQKPIAKMPKADLQQELKTWGKPTDGTVKELRNRLDKCYK